MKTNSSPFNGLFATVLLYCALVELPAATAMAAGVTELVSVASDGTQLSGRNAHGLSISTDGRFVAFVSQSPDQALFRMCGQIFVRDRATHTTEAVSLASDGTVGNDTSCFPSISGDGRFVAFESDATNLVPGDTNGVRDVFVRDRLTGKTELVSAASNGTLGNHNSSFASISGDGRFIAFTSSATNLVPADTNGAQDVFVRDRVARTTERVSVGLNGQGNDDSFCFGTAISDDGHYVAFHSSASNLVPGDTNGKTDVFIRDRVTDKTERVSIASNSAQGNGDSGDVSISADGRFVAFDSMASNLVADDTNEKLDVFVHDRLTRTTERVSVASDGTQADGIPFQGALSLFPSISADGRFVSFSSVATNLVAGDTNDKLDAFMHDRVTRTTERVSVASDGTQGTAGSGQTATSGDGRFVAFSSLAPNLVPGDANAQANNDGLDIFVRDRQTSLLAPRISVDNVSVVEGPAGSLRDAVFTVSLSPKPISLRSVITVSYWTDNGTARARSDYVSTSGTLTFVLGESSKTIAVPIIGDNIFELREFFVLNLDVPFNAVIADGQGVCTILNDDSLIGTAEVKPEAATVAIHESLIYAFSWTVPAPMNWHDLKDLQFRIRESGNDGDSVSDGENDDHNDHGNHQRDTIILSVIFNEADRTFSVYNEAAGRFGPGALAGSNKRLQTRFAVVDLAQTSVAATGPTSPTVTLNLALSFKPPAAASKYIVEVAASDDAGDVADFVQAGTMTIISQQEKEDWREK